MRLKLRVLGCGTSSGVPRIGGDWGACDPSDPRNRRTRVSILVESATTRILVDTSPDLREQLLAAQVAKLDAVMWTHDHADHCPGIDDLRQVFHAMRAPVRGLARPATIDTLRARFAYAFAGRSGYPATVAVKPLLDSMMIGDIRVRAVDQPHGAIFSAGLRFERDGAAIAYATDFNILTPDMQSLYNDLDLWVVDALRDAPHPTHPTVADALGWIAALAPGRAVLTHMDQSLDYAALAARLPANVVPGHDGLEIAL